MKSIALFSILSALVLLLSCSSEEGKFEEEFLLGRWVVLECKVEIEGENKEAADQLEEIVESITYVLKDDYSIDIKYDFTEEVTNGKWEYDENTSAISISYDSNGPITLTYLVERLNDNEMLWTKVQNEITTTMHLVIR